MATPPDAWHAYRVIFDVETRQDRSPRLIGFGVRVGGGRPEVVICPWAPPLIAWIQAHEGGWVAFHAQADLDFLAGAGVTLRGRIDDLPLALVLCDERDWGGREDLDDSRPKRRSLKLAAQYFLGHPDWTPPEILAAKTEDALQPEWNEISDATMGRYCAQDIHETLLLCDIVRTAFAEDPRLRHLYETISRPLWDVLRQAHETGVPVDAAALRKYFKEVSQSGQAFEAEVAEIVGHKVKLGSYKEKKALLYTTLELPVLRWTEKNNPSTSRKALARLRGRHDVVDILERLSAAKSEAQTYKSWLPWVANGRAHVRFNVSALTSGRTSTSDPNLQGTPHGRPRTLIRAPEGRAILVADYRTLEFGVGAWRYDEPNMLQAYLSGDAHAATAVGLLGRLPEPGTDERKTYGKIPNYGLTFGMSPEKFYEYGLDEGLSWAEDESRDIYNRWHEHYCGVRPAWARIAAEQQARGYLTSLSGRRRRWRRITRYAQRQGVNFLVQSTAAEIAHAAVILAMTRSAIPDLGGRLLLTSHDSLLLEVPQDNVIAVARCLEVVMTIDAKNYFAEQFQCEVPIPLSVEIAAGPSWGEAEPVVTAVEVHA
jgi:DNA polymerase-1